MKNKVICNAIHSTGVCGECPFSKAHTPTGAGSSPCKINANARLISIERYVEIMCANRLKAASFQPGSFDKSFVSKINVEPDYVMSDKGRDFMFSLVYKYRRQIPIYQKIRKYCIDYFEVDPENFKK